MTEELTASVMERVSMIRLLDYLHIVLKAHGLPDDVHPSQWDHDVIIDHLCDRPDTDDCLAGDCDSYELELSDLIVVAGRAANCLMSEDEEALDD